MAYQIVFLVLAALSQISGAFAFWGIIPNFVLIFLLPLSFFVKDWRRYFLLVFIGALLLSSQITWDWPVIALVGTLIIVYLIKDKLPIRTYFSIPILVAIATVIINLPFFMPLEIIINIILAITSHLFLTLCLNPN